MDRRCTGLTLSGLLVLVVAGCNPGAMMYYLLGAPENKVPAEYPLKNKDKKDIKVLVLTSAPIDLSVDFLGAERMLAADFISALSAASKVNKERITFVPTKSIDKYKDDHPNWRARSPAEIGEKFEADFVINLEILELRLFKPNSRRELLQAFAKVTGSAYDLTQENPEPKELLEYTLEYPKGHEIPVEGNESVSKFRQRFLQQVAVELSWKFTEHPMKDRFSGGSRMME